MTTRRIESQEMQAGLFVALSLLLIIVTVVTLGREKQIFAKQEVFYTSFEDVKGLKPGAPVRLGGITIGRVSDIQFSKDPSDSEVYVTLEVNNEFLNRIRKDSQASISTQGLLGDRFLTLSAGHSPEIISPLGTIESIEGGDIADILETAGDVAGHVSSLSKNLDEILEGFQKNSFENFSSTFTNLAKITDAIQNGDGVLHALIFEPSQGNSLVELLHTSEKVSHAADALTDVLGTLREENGVLHQLIYDSPPESLQNFYHDLGEIITDLHLVTSSLAHGSGTLGALLMDSSLYDNLIKITDDAERSFFLKGAIRSSLTK